MHFGVNGARAPSAIRWGIIACALLCWVPPAVAADFATVMRKAQHSEGALDSQQMVGLVEAQGNAMQQALTRCTPSGSTIPDRFAVVFRLDAAGRAVGAWTKNETAFEECFAAAMSEILHYVPPRTPFYTSIEYRD